MSRRLINGRDWRLLSAAMNSGVKFLSSYSPWDNTDVSPTYYSETELTSGSSGALDWYQLRDAYDDFQRSPWDNRDVPPTYSSETELTSGSSIAFDWYQWRDAYDDFLRSSCHSLSLSYDHELLDGIMDGIMDDVFDYSVWDYHSHFDEDELLDDVEDELLDDVVDEVSDKVSDSSGKVAHLLKSGMLPRKFAHLFKSGVLQDMSHGTSVIQEEKTWELCGLASTSYGLSGGFYHLPSLSSSSLGQIVHSGYLGNKINLWSPSVSHAIAATDPSVGSRGTRTCLISMLEHNHMPSYFKNAGTKVYFLGGGNYNKYHIPGVLQNRVQKVASTSASRNFLRSLKKQQPKQRLLGSQETVYVLQWYYSPEKGLGFHGMWVGEVQTRQTSDGQKSYVCCVQNDLQSAPYTDLLNTVEEQVRMLPNDLLEEMDRTWISRPDNHDIVQHAAGQYLRHAVQGHEILVSDYWSKATELARILDNDKLMDIMEKYGFEWGEYYNTDDFMTAVSEELETIVRVSYVDHPQHGVVPYGFTVLYDYEFHPKDHVNTSTTYSNFTFGGSNIS